MRLSVPYYRYADWEQVWVGGREIVSQVPGGNIIFLERCSISLRSINPDHVEYHLSIRLFALNNRGLSKVA